MKKQQIEVDQVNRTIQIPHWGITLRTLYGAAIANWTDPQPEEIRSYTVYLYGAEIATIHVQQYELVLN